MLSDLDLAQATYQELWLFLRDRLLLLRYVPGWNGPTSSLQKESDANAAVLTGYRLPLLKAKYFLRGLGHIGRAPSHTRTQFVTDSWGYSISSKNLQNSSLVCRRRFRPSSSASGTVIGVTVPSADSLWRFGQCLVIGLGSREMMLRSPQRCQVLVTTDPLRC
jgi:hypothetical protein